MLNSKQIILNNLNVLKQFKVPIHHESLTRTSIFKVRQHLWLKKLRFYYLASDNVYFIKGL